MRKHRKHKDLWITKDGELEYGDITLFDTSLWSEFEMASIEWARPERRLELAKDISKRYYRMYEAILAQLEETDVRTFIVDEDGVSEVDPNTGEPI